MSIRESGGEMIVKYADGKPRRTPRRSATFAYEFDGFRSSEEFLVIEHRSPEPLEVQQKVCRAICSRTWASNTLTCSRDTK
ncbi:hypothetical protein PF007_g28924 [Phytophthora fragariae]|uniref:Uncharacterized protein n=1 Tax=Phytophthora fragariae TaxID=53985 RepID=A0A6A3HB42_9STRA|nr:hypothetical protein PF009_g27984 [Phytophthora fragariae]KAE8967106.1 hypothetical protein PF011_g27677 [Phytophthora fragariae]KAE9065210.1 hypothetical protein PF007_g28924 [Phytophthora fragariae]